MLGWLKDLNITEKKTLWACFAGWALDALDVQVFSFAAPALMMVWDLTKQETGVLGTVALLSSAFGGWICGALSDRVGRVRMLQITVLWFAVFTFLCGLSQNFTQFFIFRTLQGFGFGGEWAAGSVLIAEVIRDKYRGRAGGFVQSGWAVGWGAAALAYIALFSWLDQSIAWRWLFWIGITPAFLVMFLRKHVEEPAIFSERKNRGEKALSAFSIFRARYIGQVLKIVLFVTGCQGAGYIYQVWLPTYLRTERGLSVIGTGAFTIVLIVGGFVGFILGAYCADALGRRKTFFISTFGSALMLIVYMVLPISNSVMLPSGFLLGLFTYMVFAPLGPFLTEMFPTEIRGSAQGFCYNAGRGVGALFPFLIGALSARMSLSDSIATLGFIAYGCTFIALLMLPETLGRMLATEATGDQSPKAGLGPLVRLGNVN